MRNRLLTILASSFGFILVFTSVTQASDSASEVWNRPNDYQIGMHGVSFDDEPGSESFSVLINPSLESDSSKPANCSSDSDANCAGHNVQWQALLPNCTASINANCIEEVGQVLPDGKLVPGVFQNYFPAVGISSYAGDPSRNLPTGGTGGIWKLTSATHDGGDNYYVTAHLTGSLNLADPQGKANLDSFELRIMPVQLQQRTYDSVHNANDAGYQAVPDPVNGGKRWGFASAGWDGSSHCVSNSAEQGLCAQLFNFPNGARYYVKLKLSLSPNGWLHGRISDPDISSQTVNGVTELNVEAGSVQVPIVYASAQWNQLPQNIQSQYSPAYVENSPGFTRQCCSWSNDPTQQNYTSTPLPSGQAGLDELKLWLPYVKNMATATLGEWSVRSLSGTELLGANSCFTSSPEITGIVTTNSTEYSAGPPTFDATTGSMNYQVESPHYLADSSVFKGSYNLIMRSSVARCLYGFSDAPIKAEVSVIDSEGSPEIATTVVNEAGGWLKLSANGFEFSAPTVSVKLLQNSIPVATPKPTIAQQNKISTPDFIVCQKGKVTKKVSGPSPKCPSGYKLKS